MRWIVTILILTMFFGSFVLSKEVIAQDINGQTIEVKINGLVCDFCARALQKVFFKESGVDIKDVNLSTKLLTLFVVEGRDLSDDQIKDLVTKAGYVVEKIDRK